MASLYINVSPLKTPLPSVVMLWGRLIETEPWSNLDVQHFLWVKVEISLLESLWPGLIPSTKAKQWPCLEHSCYERATVQGNYPRKRTWSVRDRRKSQIAKRRRRKDNSFHWIPLVIRYAKRLEALIFLVAYDNLGSLHARTVSNGNEEPQEKLEKPW